MPRRRSKKSCHKKSHRRFSLGKQLVNNNNNDNVPTVILESGTILFHGHEGHFDYDVPDNRPAFFGGIKVAKYYGVKVKYITSYLVTKQVRLMDLGVPKTYPNFYKTLTDKEKKVFSAVSGYLLTDLERDDCYYKKKIPAKVMYCTLGFLSNKDEENDVYAMLRFAKLLCLKGYDGYYLPNKFKLAYDHRTNISEQIVLCRPKNGLVKIKRSNITKIAKRMHDR